MIGIICAMEVEAKALKDAIIHPTVRRVGGKEFVSGELEGQEVVIGMAGVGKVNAAMCTQAMVLTYAPSLIVNSGVAGSLTPRLNIGDIAVGTGVVQYDFDTTAAGDALAYFNELGGDTFPCDADLTDALLKVAAALGIRALPAKIASGDQFISDSGSKARLVRLFGVEACEMEAGAIAHVCFHNGVRCAVIRSISDSTDGEHQREYYKFLPVAASNSARLTIAFLRSLS